MDVLKTIKELKEQPFGQVALPGNLNNEEYRLVLLTKECGDKPELMEMLGRWRKENERWFDTIFKITLEGTTQWFRNLVTGAPDRLLFLIEINGKHIGHVGLFRFNFKDMTCEVDNIIRGEKGYPGLMESAIRTMMAWGRETLGLKSYTLHAGSINKRALRLYSRLGFIVKNRVPLVRTEKGDRIEWVKAPPGYTGEIKWYTLEMALAPVKE
jgi:RimJ/RimL family protein N-acetyltransferase